MLNLVLLMQAGKLVTAQQVQLFQKRILLGKWFPGRAIQTQGIGKTPGVQVIALGPAGSFSISVRSSRFGVKRINCAIGRLKQLVDHSALAGFDGHCQRYITGGLLTPLLPAFKRMSKTKTRPQSGRFDQRSRRDGYTSPSRWRQSKRKAISDAC